MSSSVIESSRKASTNNKLDAIEEALMAFRLANNRLPCPGDETLTDIPANSTTYGYEANNISGTCTGGTPTANYWYTLPSPSTNTNIPGGTTVAEGAVPVKALGLPDEFQWDGWGRKFAYAIWTPLTATNAFINYGTYPSCGAITVQNAGGGNRTTSAAYALVSFGPDGHGGYLKSGPQRMNSGSDNADELINCHCTSNLLGNPAYAATYVEHDPNQSNSSDPNNMFGDIVRFKDRWQMQNAYDGYVPNGIPCWPGFHADDATNGWFYIAVGDVNGDGIPDLIIGAPNHNSRKGKVYVIFGTRSGFPDPLPLSSLNGTNGFELDGVAPNGKAGSSVAVGDINSDDNPDIIIGAPSANGRAGRVYVIFGGPTMKNGRAWTSCTPCTLDNTGALSSLLNGVNGFELDGMASSEAGYSLAAGDVNGDGIPDLIIGAPGINSGEGAAYVVFGGRTNMNNNVSGSNTAWSSCIPGNCLLNNSNPYHIINGSNGVELDGTAANGATGWSVTAGDVNGDGYADIMIGAPQMNSNAGAVDVVFGGQTNMNNNASGSNIAWSSCTPGNCTLNNSGSYPVSNGSNGFELDGAAAGGYAGWSVAAADLNGDGYADIITTAIGVNSNAGAVDVVFGGQTNMNNNASGSNIAWSSCTPGNCTLNNSGSYPVINGVNGFELDGSTPPGSNDLYLAVGDVNGDGYADIIIGAPGINSNAGAVDVVFGGQTNMNNNAGGSNIAWSSCTPGNCTLSNSGSYPVINGSNGVQFYSPASNLFTGGTVAAGDINNDGIADLIIGVPDISGGGSGSVYTYFGHKTTPLDPWPASPYNLGGL